MKGVQKMILFSPSFNKLFLKPFLEKYFYVIVSSYCFGHLLYQNSAQESFRTGFTFPLALTKKNLLIELFFSKSVQIGEMDYAKPGWGAFGTFLEWGESGDRVGKEWGKRKERLGK